MTVELAGAFWVLPLTVGMLGLSGLLIVVRLLLGPTGPDRVVAIDALTLLGVAAVALGAMISGQIVFLDVAVVLSLVAFVGTVAFAPLFRKLERDHDPAVDEHGSDKP
ncbi:MAG: pH regulation protein F [Rhodocyclaceae bacterium]|jgi:multicomponent Na+:H+ antiporter subunit F|nr:pH regulation protein F [Rhodocyclaceae bacterium]MCL4758902.1 pH regulation protein F [Rhodocyclaceae bacterium]